MSMLATGLPVADLPLPDFREPYSGLRYLHKPVDLIIPNTDEHILTNAAVAMVSQGDVVDWFRFVSKMKKNPIRPKLTSTPVGANCENYNRKTTRRPQIRTEAAYYAWTGNM